MPESPRNSPRSGAGANTLQVTSHADHEFVPDGSHSPSPAAGHDAAGYHDAAPSARPRGPWPTRARTIKRHGSLVRLVGDFGDEDLELVRTALPARQVTRDGDVITVWPAGSWTAASHENGLVLLTGHFDAQDVTAVRNAHPDQYVSLDGQTLTLWPTTLAPGRIAPGAH